MALNVKQRTAAYLRHVISRFGDGLTTIQTKGPGQIQYWLIALCIGLAAGFAALGFRRLVSWLQTQIYGANDYHLATSATWLPWYFVLIVPILGGLAVGLILARFTDNGRCHSISQVIEGAAIHDGKVSVRAGLASALASLITLSTGGSTGREGPVVHLGAVLSTKVSQWMKFNAVDSRDLMACAAAAAVSASFNAPIAGVIFALEVILRHTAIHAFAPVVIASVAGTVVSRLEYGDITEFFLPEHKLEFYQELPAFLLLGLVCGLVAVAMMKAIFLAEDVGDRLQKEWQVPGWLRPAIAGAMLGAIAIYFPHIIGVGYQTTSRALSGYILFWDLVVLATVKVIAVAITLGGRMGGGVFSPSLMLGALTGLAFGIVATSLFPQVSGTETLYALAGMGAVAAAVLGAPISTTLIVFEMTGDWQTGLAVMVAVSTATALSSRMVDMSFFLTTLERRNLHVSKGPQEFLASTILVRDLMRSFNEEKSKINRKSWKKIERGFYLDLTANLEIAMPILETSKAKFIPLVNLSGQGEPAELVGYLYYVDALAALNAAMAEYSREEHS